MRNAGTLVERMALAKAIEGELFTFDVDLHEIDGEFVVYVYDPEEAFDTPPQKFVRYEEAKAAFDRFVQLLREEPVMTAESVFDFAERILAKLGLY